MGIRAAGGAGCAPAHIHMKPEITAIVSVKDEPLDGVLKDLAEQTVWPVLEVVIVDASEIAQRFEGRVNEQTLYLHRPGCSIWKAWNIATEHATGKFITTANADDRHLPNGLEVLAYELASRHVGIVYGDHLLVGVPGCKNCHGVWRQFDFTPWQALTICPFGPAPMWKADMHLHFDENSASDYKAFLHASLAYGAWHVPKYVGFAHDDKESWSRVNGKPEDIMQFLGPLHAAMGAPEDFLGWCVWCWDHGYYVISHTRSQIAWRDLYRI
jgi:glycosyltransferase involved in cell wall biosynthesis